LREMTETVSPMLVRLVHATARKNTNIAKQNDMRIVVLQRQMTASLQTYLQAAMAKQTVQAPALAVSTSLTSSSSSSAANSSSTSSTSASATPMESSSSSSVGSVAAPPRDDGDHLMPAIPTAPSNDSFPEKRSLVEEEEAEERPAKRSLVSVENTPAPQKKERKARVKKSAPTPKKNLPAKQIQPSLGGSVPSLAQFLPPGTALVWSLNGPMLVSINSFSLPWLQSHSLQAQPIIAS